MPAVLYVVRMNAPGAATLRQGWAVCLLLLGTLIVARAIVGHWPQSAYLSAIAPTLFAAIIGDFFGREHAGTLVGFLFMLAGSMGACGPVLAGVVYDAVGDYRPAFMVS